MKKILFLVLVSLLLDSCSRVPLTGRRQTAWIPGSELMSMSYSNYSNVLEEEDVVEDTPEARRVKKVGHRIQRAVEEYMKEHRLEKHLEGYAWDFNLIESDAVNAWCMPGGKVAFYTGIMPICETEAGVAVVMGHEVAHAIANHGNERMTHGLIQQAGGVALAIALHEKPVETQALFLASYGVATTVGGMLPFSRTHESEADRMGLIFMAMAGYDPNEAPAFWERMRENSGGKAPPEFLSTHPAHDTRINDLKKQIPEAMKYYNEDFE